MQESAYGLICIHCGCRHRSVQQHSFAYPPDVPVVDDITKKPFHKGQKPAGFFRRVVQIHTLSGEWVLSGYSGIGKVIIML